MPNCPSDLQEKLRRLASEAAADLNNETDRVSLADAVEQLLADSRQDVSNFALRIASIDNSRFASSIQADEVKACSWCRCEEERPTFESCVRYWILGGFPERWLESNLKVEFRRAIGDMVKLRNQLYALVEMRHEIAYRDGLPLPPYQLAAEALVQAAQAWRQVSDAKRQLHQSLIKFLGQKFLTSAAHDALRKRVGVRILPTDARMALDAVALHRISPQTFVLKIQGRCLPPRSPGFDSFDFQAHVSIPIRLPLGSPRHGWSSKCWVNPQAVLSLHASVQSAD